MEEKIKLELTKNELNIILYSLQKQPYEAVAEPIKNIVAQLQPKVEVAETKE